MTTAMTGEGIGSGAGNAVVRARAWRDGAAITALGTLLGAAGGALAGRAIDRNNVRCR